MIGLQWRSILGSSVGVHDGVNSGVNSMGAEWR